jgi:hypothetical protein
VHPIIRSATAVTQLCWLESNGQGGEGWPRFYSREAGCPDQRLVWEPMRSGDLSWSLLHEDTIDRKNPSVGGLRLLKVLKNTINMFSKCNILLQEPSALR